MRNCWTALAWTIVLTITGIPSASASEVLMIFDSSASMEERTSDGVRRIDGAKAAFQSLVPKLSNQQVGLIVFGHRVAANTDGCCEDIERIIPIGEFSSGAFNDAVMRLQPTGNTPLAQSLMTARDVLVSRGQKSPASRDVPKAIVVLTDGTETCNGNPQGVAAELFKLGIDVRIHVVGFAVQRKEEQQLREIATAGGGIFVAAADAASLEKELRHVVEVAVAQVPTTPTAPTELSRIGKALVARLQDSNADVRNKAAQTLLKLRITAAVPYLIDRVQDEAWSGYKGGYAKNAALAAIQAMAPEKVQVTLIGAAESESSYVRIWAINKLQERDGPKSGVKLNAVDTVLTNALTDKLADVRYAAAVALRQRKITAAVPHLVKRVLDGQWSGYRGGYAKNEALLAIKEMAPQKLEETLLAAMESESSYVRDWATNQLGSIFE